MGHVVKSINDPSKNRLLAALPPAILERWLPMLERFEMHDRLLPRKVAT